VKLLLDTQALLLWLDGGARLSPRVRALIADRTNEVLVSAASAFEITTKHRLGKLPAATPLVLDFSEWTTRAGFAELPIGISHAARAGSFPAEHRDPFDRLLSAQSLVEAVPIVSGDDALDGFGVQRIW
jgi:PIN domain nuclease of toxin-antitoxin system